MKTAQRLKEMDHQGLEWEMRKLEQEEEKIKMIIQRKQEQYEAVREVFQKAESEFNSVDRLKMTLQQVIWSSDMLKKIGITTESYQQDIENLSSYQLTLKDPLEEKDSEYQKAKEELSKANDKLRRVRESKINLRNLMKSFRAPQKDRDSYPRSRTLYMSKKEVCSACGRIPTDRGNCGCSN